MALLSLCDARLACGLGHLPLLDGAELALHRGEDLAQIGRSGAG